MEYEYWLHYYAEHPPAPATDPLTDAWMDAVARGAVNPQDPASVRQWQAQHGIRPTAKPPEEWEPVTMPPREGATPDGRP